ncbi:forkhead box protein k1 [Plakobranchus ocellatus]|uniref:Forkhead box protein k1 n=1 Tax=Plakobranchus ocellatus TaxID=259542 RepID=A0AAV4CXN1_9GAST|nr:forkhead box protein k1 [Plakobranchus ocellatus]
MVDFARSMGKGHDSLQKCSTYLNSPSPMTFRNYKKSFSKIHSASMEVATESICATADEVKKLKENKQSLDLTADVTETSNCAVFVDGTWQRRGHASYHGVVTAISVDTGKCLDFEVLSNICKDCKHWETKKGHSSV